MQLKIGADPELFVEYDGKIVSGYGLIKGTKEKPEPVADGAVQVDGLALEINIKPATTCVGFVSHILSVLHDLDLMLPHHKLIFQSTAQFDPKYLKTLPLNALVLGCDPDYNAWTKERNNQPDASVSFRTAAGHVHIGWTENESIEDAGHLSICYRVVQQLDFFLGLPSVLFDPDIQRRELYGKAGAFRAKPYGVEYRVLSNKWLQSQNLMEWVYTQTVDAVHKLRAGYCLADRYGDIQEIINTSDKVKAEQIIITEKLEMPNV